MNDICKNIQECNLKKKRRILIILDDMIADMLSSKNLNPILTELFIVGRKLNISFAFIKQSYFVVPKNIRLNSTHFFVMKTPNKRELEKIANNHSSAIEFKDFMNLYKEFTAKPYSFLVIYATPASDNPSRFRKYLLERILKLSMTIDDKVRDEKLQYGIYRKTAKISALSSGKTDKYEYLTGNEILPSNQRQMIEQAKFAYSPSGKAFEKQTEKQVGILKSLDLSNKKDELKQIEGIFPQNLMIHLIRINLKKSLNCKILLKKYDLNYKSNRGKTYNFGKCSLPIVF